MAWCATPRSASCRSTRRPATTREVGGKRQVRRRHHAVGHEEAPTEAPCAATERDRPAAVHRGHERRGQASVRAPGPWCWLGRPRPEHPAAPAAPPVRIGIDFGPAFATVTRNLVARWGISDGDVVSAALGNVRALAVELPPEVVKTVDLDDGAVVRVLQSGAGWASTLLLVPDLLPRFFGPGPHLLGAPCRDVVMAFSARTSLDLIFDLVEGLAWADPVGLVAACYRHVDGSLEQVPAPPPGSVVPLGVSPPVRTRFVS